MNKTIKFSKVFLSLIFVVGIMSMGGCDPQWITVGGWIPTADEGNTEVGSNIPLNNKSDKANFGGVVDTCDVCTLIPYWPYIDCDLEKLFSDVTFHDGDMRIKMTVIDVQDCNDSPYSTACRACSRLANDFDDCGIEDAYEGPLFISAGKVLYSSQNPKYKDKKNVIQYGYICTTDNGEGFNGGQAEFPDVAGIILKEGIFKNYANCGPVQGNVQQDSCYEEVL